MKCKKIFLDITKNNILINLNLHIDKNGNIHLIIIILNIYRNYGNKNIYFIFLLITNIDSGRGAGTILMDYFNNLSIEDKLFIENISSYYFRQTIFFIL